MYRTEKKEITCPCTHRKETVFFIPLMDGTYLCNGCESANGTDICTKCQIRQTEEYNRAD